MSRSGVVRCGWCELVQFAGEACRRCKKALPSLPDPVIVTVIVTKPVLLGALFPEVLPTAAEWELLLLREAIKRAGNPNLAAKLIGISKTTAYRRIHEPLVSKRESGQR